MGAILHRDEHGVLAEIKPAPFTDQSEALTAWKASAEDESKWKALRELALALFPDVESQEDDMREDPSAPSDTLARADVCAPSVG